jgi:hypothetical protein
MLLITPEPITDGIGLVVGVAIWAWQRRGTAATQRPRSSGSRARPEPAQAATGSGGCSKGAVEAPFDELN